MSYLPRSTTQSLHDQVVKDIAANRFDPVKYDVYTNPGSTKNAYVGTANLYPDIVVLEKGVGRRSAIAIGEVETAESINMSEAVQWAKYTNTNIPFYLYVPAGHANAAKSILLTKGIKISGLRTYKYSPLTELIITNIF